MANININGWTPPNIKMMQPRGTIKISNNGSLWNANTAYEKQSLVLYVTAPNGSTTTFNSTTYTQSLKTYFREEEFNVQLDRSGEYKLEFVIKWTSNQTSGNWSVPSNHTKAVTTYIYVNPDSSKELKPYSLGDTIRRLLDLTPTRMTSSYAGAR